MKNTTLAIATLFAALSVSAAVYAADTTPASGCSSCSGCKGDSASTNTTAPPATDDMQAGQQQAQ